MRSVTGVNNDQRKLLVLVVDDDPAVLQTLRAILNRRGFEVETAPDGERAMELVRAHRFEAIISDIDMPGMNGIELLSAIRGIEFDVPVILLTGKADVETAIQAVNFGAYRFLTKPVLSKELVETVHNATKVHRLAKIKRHILRAAGRNASAPADVAGLEASFARALEGLWMAYQPIVSFRERRVHAFEALLRSSEPSLPDPGVILAAAEQLERIDELGRTIRGRVAGAAAELDDGQFVFVNVHPLDLLDDELFRDSSPLSRIAERVVLEITERACLHQIDRLPQRLAELRSLGFRLAIDDLGAGYSGLTSFVQVNPEVAKIDMGLIRGIDADSTKQGLVRSILGVCREMNIDVVAEGVETQEEIRALDELDAPLLQGYALGRPAAAFTRVPEEVFFAVT